MRIILLALVVLLTGFMNGQKISDKMDFKKGLPLEAKGTDIRSVIGKMGNGYVVVREDKDGIFLERLSATMRVVKSADLSDKMVGEIKKTNFHRGFQMGGRLFLIFSANDKKAGLLRYAIDEYDPTTLAVKKRIHNGSTSLTGLNSVYWYGIGAGNAISESSELLGTDISLDSSMFVLYTSKFDKDKSSNEEVGVEVFDATMKLVWKKEFELPFQQKDFSIRDMVVDNNGNVHLLGRESLSRAESKEQDTKDTWHKYHVITYNQDGTSKQYMLSVKDYNIRDAAIEINTEGHLIACGYFAFPQTSQIVGAFYTKVDLEKQTVLVSNDQKFNFDIGESVDEEEGEEDDEAKAEPVDDKKAKKDEKKEAKKTGVYSLYLDGLVLTEDGGALLVGEQFYWYTVQYATTANGVTTWYTKVVYVYGSMVVNRVNSSGQIQWSTKIPKRQSSSAFLDYLSYSYSVCNDKLYLIYNDHIKSHTTEKIYRYGGPFGKYGIVSLAVVNADGTFTRELLVPHSEDNVALAPGSSMFTGNCEMLCFFKTRKEYQFFLGTMTP
ncbi:MAG: hypothetical protein JNM00_07225 [Flavobacteriales bacterium]|nr:hypothetical protein [Flavobacteriales bacterium]